MLLTDLHLRSKFFCFFFFNYALINVNCNKSPEGCGPNSKYLQCYRFLPCLSVFFSAIFSCFNFCKNYTHYQFLAICIYQFAECIFRLICLLCLQGTLICMSQLLIIRICIHFFNFLSHR